MRIWYFSSVILAILGLAASNPVSAPTQSTSLTGFTAPDGAANDYFGYSVSLSGSLAIVGAFTKTIGSNSWQGKAYAYNCDTSSCSLVTSITADDGAEYDQFGYSVAISGNLAVIGARGKAVGSNYGQGKAYLYNCNAASCSLVTGFTPDDGAGSDLFGFSVSISGNLVIVGANQKAIGSNDQQGKAYVYNCDTSSCSLITGITATDGAAYDHFGYSVAISGNLAIVGASGKTIGSNNFQGKVYIYNCDTSCSLITAITLDDGAVNDNFGFSVAISGNLALISAPGKTVGSNSAQGKVYVYNCDTSSCSLVTTITADDGVANDNFGTSVSISGNQVIVGAYFKTVGSNSAQGKVYVYNCDTASCSSVTSFTSGDGTANDLFGYSVSSFGNLAIVGAPYKIIGSNYSQGKVYLAALPASPTAAPTATPTPPQFCLATVDSDASWPKTHVGEATYGTCQSGFSGRPYRTCLTTGSFGTITNPCQTTIPTSAPAPRFCLSTVDGDATWPETHVGEATYGVCQSGFSGRPYRTCLTTGSFGTITNPCQVACPAQVINEATFPITVALASATGSCPTGKYGNPVRICQADRSWGSVTSGTECYTPGNCPPMEYGRQTFPETLPGQIATGTCIAGTHTPAGSPLPVRECYKSGNWSTLVNYHCAPN